MNKALDKLCEILIEQNVAINSAIERKTINWDMVVEYNKDAIKSIKKLRKKLVNESKAKPNISVKIEPEANSVFRLERFTEVREFTYLGKHFPCINAN